ncbi:MAG: RNA polymerase sigma factor [Capsulimonadaceae bacterium]
MFLTLILAVPIEDGESGSQRLGGHGSADGAGQSDYRLVTAAQKGDSQAFAALHVRYYARIYRLAYLKTNNAADAEDVASETFLRALGSLARFNFKNAPGGKTASLYPWLHRIAMNLIVDSCRQRPPASVVSLDAPVVEGMRDLLGDRLPGGSGTLSPQEIVERNEVQQLVRSAIAALPEDHGEILIYRFLGGLSLREMASQMERSESAVKSLLHRAVVGLRAEIRRRVDAVERLDLQAHRRVKSNNEVTQHVGRRPG